MLSSALSALRPPAPAPWLRTLFDKLWDSHVVCEPAGQPASALRRPAPRARGDVAPSVRGAEARWAARSPSGADRGDRRPQRPDDGPSPADRGRGRETDRALARTRPHPAYGSSTSTRASRESYTSSAPSSASRSPDDDRLRRQPHEHARRVRGPRVRDRHLRGRTCARDAVPASTRPRTMMVRVDGPLRIRRHGQGPRPRHHPRDRDRRRGGVRGRVHGRRSPGALDGGAHDALQHDHRSGRPGGPRRPRRDDVRVRSGTALRSVRGRLGAAVAAGARRPIEGPSSTERRRSTHPSWRRTSRGGTIPSMAAPVTGRVPRATDPLPSGRSPTWP